MLWPSWVKNEAGEEVLTVGKQHTFHSIGSNQTLIPSIAWAKIIIRSNKRPQNARPISGESEEQEDIGLPSEAKVDSTMKGRPLWKSKGWNKLMHALHGNGPTKAV